MSQTWYICGMLGHKVTQDTRTLMYRINVQDQTRWKKEYISQCTSQVMIFLLLTVSALSVCKTC